MLILETQNSSEKKTQQVWFHTKLNTNEWRCYLCEKQQPSVREAKLQSC